MNEENILGDLFKTKNGRPTYVVCIWMCDNDVEHLLYFITNAIQHATDATIKLEEKKLQNLTEAIL